MSGNEEVENKDIEEPSVEEEVVENQEQNEEALETEEKEEVIEQWMSSDEENIEQTNEENQEESSQEVPVGKHVFMKHKLRRKITEKDDEIEQLRKEIESLKTSSVPTQEVKTEEKLSFPRIENFDFDEDKYNKAVDDYIEKKAEFSIKSAVSKRDQQLNSQKAYERQSIEVDKHLDRVTTLIQKSNIAEDDYTQAEKRVRMSIEKIAPGRGNAITEAMIAAVGDGSEKVMYWLGRNNTARSKFQKLLINDPTGLSSIAYLGKQVERLKNPIKVKTQAQKPGVEVKGDLAYSGNAKGLKGQYDKAEKADDAQKAFELRLQAKKQGVDVSSW